MCSVIAQALEDTATSLQEQEKELQSEMKEHESAVAELTAQKEREVPCGLCWYHLGAMWPHGVICSVL